jgi:streptogramin lyase
MNTAMSKSNTVSATVLYNYKANDNDELSVQKGDKLIVLETYDDGWWMVQGNDSIGLLPSNYLEVHEVPASSGAKPSLSNKGTLFL